MSAVYEGAVAASAESTGAQELRGLNRTQFLETVKVVTTALGSLPSETSMHVAVLAVTYVRNALLSAMHANQAYMMNNQGGSA